MSIIKILSYTQMGKFFSHFGIRSLLILYLVQSLKTSDSKAIGISALFCALAELSAVFGGMLADKLLGLKRSVILGSIILTAGYLSLLFEEGLYGAMGLIIAGNSLFNGNITALLGKYSQDRQKDFTFFYMMQNIGGLVATLVCGVIALHFGYKLGFAVASLGMLASLLLYNKIPDEDIRPRWGIAVLCLLGICLVGGVAPMAEKWILPWLPYITVGLIISFGLKLLKDVKFLVCLSAIVIFFAMEDQILSSITLFANSSLVACLNPLVIILLGTLLAKYKLPISIPFLITALSFGLVSYMPIPAVALLSVAELLIGPAAYAYASEVAQRGSAGKVMGLVPLAFSLAYQLSGTFGKMVATSSSYTAGFWKIALIALAFGIVIQGVQYVRNRALT